MHSSDKSPSKNQTTTASPRSTSAKRSLQTPRFWSATSPTAECTNLLLNPAALPVCPACCSLWKAIGETLCFLRPASWGSAPTPLPSCSLLWIWAVKTSCLNVCSWEWYSWCRAPSFVPAACWWSRFCFSGRLPGPNSDPLISWVPHRFCWLPF